ncbi:MAG: sigma-70 family RNA polymerase sigma factor [Polyangiaceae bacterium]
MASHDRFTPPEDAAALESLMGLRVHREAEGALSAEIAVIYRRHRDLVLRLALRYGGGQRAWAEDVTHDVFLGLWSSLSSLDRRDELEGFLYRATTHRCLTKLRRERLLSILTARWLFGEDARHAEPALIAREDLRRALESLSVLPPKERVAFSMYYLDGKEQDEIGEVLGHSKGQVSKLIARAVAKLRARGIEVPDG